MLLLHSMCMPRGAYICVFQAAAKHACLAFPVVTDLSGLYGPNPVGPCPDSLAAVQIVTAWNGMGIAAFAEAAIVLKQEQPAATRDFPVEGCDPSEYQRAAIKVLAWRSAVFTCPAKFSAVLVGCVQQPHRGHAWPCCSASPVTLGTLLVYSDLMHYCLPCMAVAKSCRPL